MSSIEYHDIVRSHTKFKKIVDRLKEQRISRDDIHEKVALDGRQLTKSTITRFYNDPSEGKIHNLKLLIRYTDWIEEAFSTELGLKTNEPDIEDEKLRHSINLLYKEVKALRRLSRAAIIRQARSRYRRR